MKYIIAIIKPHKLDPVREALTALGVSGMTVTEVKGFGRQKGQTEIYRGAEYETNMVPKMKIEIACASDQAPAVIEAIQHAAETGAIGAEQEHNQRHAGQSERHACRRVGHTRGG